MSKRITGRCPSCGSGTLFVGVGGYVTCSLQGCPDPGAASDALDGTLETRIRNRAFDEAAAEIDLTDAGLRAGLTVYGTLQERILAKKKPLPQPSLTPRSAE